jgi:hypothetical protein
MRIARLIVFIVASFGSLAGCASTPAPVGPTVLAPLPARVVVVPSFVPSDATVILRFDGRAIRETEIAYELSRMIAVSGTWSTLSAGSDADPIADVDVMLCASRATIGDRGLVAASWYFVLRHTRTHDEVVQRIARIGEVQNVPVTWAEQDGFRYVNLPVSRGGFAPHVVVLSAVGELVVAPATDLSRVIEIAGQQARARRGDEAVDPFLRTEPDELVFWRMDVTNVTFPATWTVAPPRSFELRASLTRTLPEPEIGIRSELGFATGADAEAAHARGDELLAQWSDNMMISLTPIGSVVRATTLSTEEVTLVASSRFTMERARSLAQFLTTLQGRASEGSSPP